jgi:cysteine synthase A
MSKLHSFHSAKPLPFIQHNYGLFRMPDLSQYHLFGAFLLGAGLTTIWAIHKSEIKIEQQEHVRDLNNYKKHFLQLSKIKDPDILKKTLAELAEPTDPIFPDIKEGIEGCIGNTPLIKIKSLSEATGCEILAKAEFLNGAGNSPKDRVALSIIQMAEEKGLMIPHSGDTIYEGTVGSTGISLAAICRARGYKAHM